VVFADQGNDLIRAYIPKSGRVINLAGKVSVDGRPQKGFDGDGHFADQTVFSAPAAVTTTRDGRIVVADTGNYRVRELTPSP